MNEKADLLGRSWRWLRLVDRWPQALTWYGVVAGLMCFWRLGAAGLVSMEGMVVDGARQMLASGNWIVPRVYGELYTYKPALAYWLETVPLRIAEMPAEWLVRLPFAVLGFVLGGTILGFVGRLVCPRTGLYSALAVVSGVLFQQKVRIAEFDIALIAGVGVAVVAACYNLVKDEDRFSVWLVGYIALAGGFLAKGGPALMAYGPGMLAAAVATARFRRLFGWRHLAVAVAFTGLVGVYLWAAWHQEGAAAFEQPLLEAKARGLGWLWGQTEEAAAELAAFRKAEGEAEITGGVVGALGRTLVKPFVIWGIAMPWAVLLPAAFWRHRRPIEDRTMLRLVGACRGFLLAGAAAFMLTSSNESRYYLPLTVPLGILCGVVAGGAFPVSERWRRELDRLITGVAFIVAFLTPLVGVLQTTPAVKMLDRAALVVIGLAALWGVILLAKRRPQEWLAGLLVITSLCFLASWSLVVEQRRAGTRDLRGPALLAGRYLPGGAEVWTLGPADVAGADSSLYFYLGRRVLVFRSGSELPSGGVFCIIPSDRQAELGELHDAVFEEIERIEHVRKDFLLGKCLAASGESP